MSGRLDLSTPWARQRIDPTLREELERDIPDGYTIGVSVAAYRHGKVKAWVNTPGLAHAHHVYRWDAERAVRDCIDWIAAQVSA